MAMIRAVPVRLISRNYSGMEEDEGWYVNGVLQPWDVAPVEWWSPGARPGYVNLPPNASGVFRVAGYIIL